MKRLRTSLLALAGLATFAFPLSVRADEVSPEAVTTIAGTLYGPARMGSETAPVTLIEYASITCGHCKHFHDTVFPSLKTRIDAGELAFEFRELPTAPHAIAIEGFKIARCSGAQHYFDVVDAFFDRQKEITAASRQGKAKDLMLEIAGTYGISAEDYKVCTKDQALREALHATEDGATAQEIFTTPTLILNGVRLEGTQFYTEEGLNAEITRLIASAPQTEISSD